MRQAAVKAVLSNIRYSEVASYIAKAPLEERFVLLCLPAIGQEHVLLSGTDATPADLHVRLQRLASGLQRVEQFYDSIGGLVGYQLKSLQLIVAGLDLKGTAASKQQQEVYNSPCSFLFQPDAGSVAAASAPERGNDQQPQQHTSYLIPKGLDLAGEAGSQVGSTAAARGLEALPVMAEIYPVGGAGDRLGLVDEVTGESLPAAMLPYAGRTLLEGLIRDLQAREYLYYKLNGQQVNTPVAIMTSDAKGNHKRITGLLESVGWMGRARDSFRLFRQPLVPVLAADDGRWLLSQTLKPMMKPGGHGVIWKLMWDEGVFDWLQGLGRQAAIVRQISNPMAGTDTTLLALAGTGYSGGYKFGFMSCERTVGAAEGMNVLQERRMWVPQQDASSSSAPASSSLPSSSTVAAASSPAASSSSSSGHWRYEYGLTNIEYTEFERLGIKDEATSSSSRTSVFPANTNVLYVQLQAARDIVAQAIASHSSEQLMPGLIFNLKKKVAYTSPLTPGTTTHLTAGRMECTMQNIADFLTDAYDEPQSPLELQSQPGRLSTFLVTNLRRKVTSSAKKKYVAGSARIAQTPDGSFYDLQRNAWQILQRCGLKNVPEPGSAEQYLDLGPGFIFLYHPALGPLWDVISQKISGGSLAQGSELVLEIAEARMIDVNIRGALNVVAENVMGHMEAQQQQQHGEEPSTPSAHTTLHNQQQQQYQQQQHQPLMSQHAAPLDTWDVDAASSRLSSSSASSPEAALPSSPTSSASSSSSLSSSSPLSSYASSQQHQQQRVLRYSSRCGRVKLTNVTITNRGVDWGCPMNLYWKHSVSYRERCQIILQGRSEFEAHDVHISGDVAFTVPDGYRMVVSQCESGGMLRQALYPMHPVLPSWEWRYCQDDAGNVQLQYASHLMQQPSTPVQVYGCEAGAGASASSASASGMNATRRSP